MTLPNLNLAFVLALTGLLVIYAEFIWVGRIIFGLVGSILLLVSVTALSRSSNILHGELLFTASLAGFVVEAFFQSRFIAGTAAVLLLAYGALTIGVSLMAAVPSTLIFGVITLTLLEGSKRARRNKLSDIT